MNIDLSVPIWTIEHVAAAFHLSVDAAREYTYGTTSRPRAAFSRHLWTRQEALARIDELPTKPRSHAGKGTVSTAAVARTASPRSTETCRPSAAPAGTRPAGGRPAGAPKPYTPRRKK